jgi:hypothetical protein
MHGFVVQFVPFGMACGSVQTPERHNPIVHPPGRHIVKFAPLA